MNVTKRYLIAAAAHNLGRILRKLFGIGKPKSLQGGSGLAALMQFIAAWFLIAVGPILGWYRPQAHFRAEVQRKKRRPKNPLLQRTAMGRCHQDRPSVAEGNRQRGQRDGSLKSLRPLTAGLHDSEMSFDKCPSSVTSGQDTLSDPVLGFNLPLTGGTAIGHNHWKLERHVAGRRSSL